MSRLRADEVLNKAATGPFLATEGVNVPVGKNITYNDLSEVTVLDGTSLTTTTLNVDQINLGDDDGTKAKSIKLGFDEDLTLYYDGRIGYVTSFIESDQLIIRPKTTPSDTYIDMLEGGPVRLYHGSTSRLSTSASGVGVNGNLDVSGDITSARLDTSATGTAITGTTTSTDGWAGTTSNANVLGGIVMPFTCGINGRVSLPPTGATMVFGGSEYSGGGDNHEGATMPHDGKLYAVTLHAEQAVGDLTLDASVNGTQNASYQISFSSPTQSNPSIIQTFYSSPMSFTAGDRLNFNVSNTTLTSLQVLTLTFFVKFD